MKFTLHIPAEQYGFIEAEVEGTEIDAVNTYHKVVDEIKKHQPVKPDTPFASKGDGLPLDEYGVCKNCGAKNVKSPKTGKIFCSDKCWLRNK